MANGSGTATMTYEDLMSSSIGSLPSTRTQSSQIAKTYRQAAQLFLTRRLPEALSTIEPVVVPPQPSADQLNGHQHSEDNGEDTPPSAPIAAASRGTRVKVWSFYLTLLNAIVELGPEEGKHQFGSSKWRGLVAKARDGSVWEDVVRDGYAGVEGDVDADVVVNLATLLLTHMPSQTTNQQRLETYLSASTAPTLDITAQHLSAPTNPHPPSLADASNGTSTPKALNSRLKLLELYTLHVLPRTDEWAYARDFIALSEVLDDERKDAFLQALQSLRDEKEHGAEREAQLRREQQEQLEQSRREEEARVAAEVEERRKADDDDDANKRSSSSRSSTSKPPQATPTPTSALPSAPQPTPTPTPTSKPRAPPSSSSSSSSRPAKKANPSAPPPAPGMYTRASSLLASLPTLLLSTSRSLSAHPLPLLRALLFLAALLLAFARRDIRQRVRRALARAWDSVRRTVGAGVKVSYI